MMVCQPRQERSGTWWREPKMGLGIAGHTSEPNPLSAGIPRRPFPAFPHAKIWLSAITQNRWWSFGLWEEIYATDTDVTSETYTDYCHRWTTGLYVLTLSGCNGEAISTRHLGHYFPSKGSNKDLDTLVFFEVLHAQLSVLIATKGDQTTTFCKVRRNSLLKWWWLYHIEEKYQPLYVAVPSIAAVWVFPGAMTWILNRDSCFAKVRVVMYGIPWLLWCGVQEKNTNKPISTSLLLQFFQDNAVPLQVGSWVQRFPGSNQVCWIHCFHMLGLFQHLSRRRFHRCHMTQRRWRHLWEYSPGKSRKHRVFEING